MNKKPGDITSRPAPWVSQVGTSPTNPSVLVLNHACYRYDELLVFNNPEGAEFIKANMGQFKSTQLSFAAKKNVFHETDVMNLSSFQDLPPRRMFRLPGTTFIQLPNLSNNYHFFADWFMRTMYNVMREGS